MGREYVMVSCEEYDSAIDSASELRAENVRLRKLVRDMWLQLLNAYNRKEMDEFADRMSELGVDV